MLKNYTIRMKNLVAYLTILLLSVFFYIFFDGSNGFLFFVIVSVVGIINFLSVVWQGKRISYYAKLEGSNEKNGGFVFRVTIENKSWIPVILLRLEIVAKNLLNEQVIYMEKESFILSRGKAKVNLGLKSAYCGNVQLKINKLEIEDLLGILRKKVLIKQQEETFNFNILPTIEETEISQEELFGYDMESFKYSDSKKGNDPGEIFGIREYQTGDSSKAIHWKLSGKLDKIMIREMGFPVENNILVILEKNIKYISYEYIDELTELFFSLSISLITKGIKHDIGWYDARKGSFIIRRVKSSADLWHFVEECLSAPISKDKLSCVREYISAESNKNYSNYILVGDGIEDIERLMEYGAVTEFGYKRKK